MRHNIIGDTIPNATAIQNKTKAILGHSDASVDDCIVLATDGSVYKGIATGWGIATSKGHTYAEVPGLDQSSWASEMEALRQLLLARTSTTLRTRKPIYSSIASLLSITSI